MRIHYPLRRMVAELRDFASERDTPPTGSEVDEMSVMGDYLRTLMTDVSETSSTLLQSRRQLVQAEKLASVGKLAASVAHEIRNPLTAMNMWLFSIRRSIADDREVVRKLDAISEEMSRLEQVVQSFLEFTRPAELRLQQVRLDTILQNTIHLLQHRLAERQIVVNFVNVESLPTVTADPDQLKQVFINLIWNAAEAIEGEGEVTITGRVGNGQAVAETVELRIRDTGHGIGEEVRNRLFEPFFTTKEDGTGLGLSIAARILVRHGGRLWLESSGPTGSCFAMRIPVAVEVEHGPHSDRG